MDFFRYEIAFFEKKGDFWESKMTYLVIYLAGAGGAVYLDVEGSLKLKPDKKSENRKNRINKVLSYLSGVGSLIGVIDLEALSAIGI